MAILLEFIAENKSLIFNKKLKVRELDEEPKGVFVAFVDEGKESYDVHISIDSKNELIKNECDCDYKKPCLHQVFLARFIADKKEISSEKTKKKSTKKIPDHHLIIDRMDECVLRDWVKETMDSNKAIRYEFMIQNTEQSYTPITIEQALLDAISSTTNNRKKLDQSQIKKLLNIFDKINHTIYDSVKNSKDIQTSALMLIVISKVLYGHYNMIKSNSMKYEAYLESLFPMLNLPLMNAQIELFTSVVDFIFEKIKTERIVKSRMLEYLFNLKDIIDTKKRLVLMSRFNFNQ